RISNFEFRISLWGSERINNPEELELVEAQISGANLNHSMLPHESGDMKIVQSVAGYARVLESEFANHLGVPLCFNQDAKRRGRAETFDKTPGLGKTQRMGKRRSMRDHSQELISD